MAIPAKRPGAPEAATGKRGGRIERKASVVAEIASGPVALGNRRLSRTSVTRQVVDVLYEALRGGQYKAGDRLPSEPQLAASLGVGRSAVREAIRELLTLDVVEIRHGTGTFVRGMRPDLMLRPESFREALDRQVAVELLEVRLIVEPGAAALAAARASSDDLERLRRDVAGLEGPLAMTGRPPEDLGFHLDLVRAAHNASLLRISSAIIAFYEHDEAIPTRRDYEEHLAVLTAIQARDPEGARLAMKAHLDNEMKVRARPDSSRQRVASKGQRNH